jgi:methylglutaconyl-CoA hydratase
MPNNGSVTLNTKNRIGTIEFHHPKANSLPGKLLRELAEKITEAGNDDDIHAIVLRSKGEGAFCAGASFDELKAIDNYEEAKHFFMGFALVLNAMRTCQKLIIVRVQGKIAGGGVGVAAAGDYTIAHTSASVKLSELTLGIGPFVVGPAIERKIDDSAFSTLAIDARSWYDAKWSYQKGLFAKIAETHKELDTMVDKLASSLAESSPEAMRELKRVLWKGTNHWDSQLEQRAEISGELILSDYSKDFF